MDDTHTGTLMKLADSGLTVADPAHDVRGRMAVDTDREEIGKITSLLIDERYKKVRFLEVESGGFLGIGGQTRLLPVDVVTGVDEDAVYVDQTREHVHGSPAHDPELTDAPAYYGAVYGYYGYEPYWTRPR